MGDKIRRSKDFHESIFLGVPNVINDCVLYVECGGGCWSIVHLRVLPKRANKLKYVKRAQTKNQG